MNKIIQALSQPCLRGVRQLRRGTPGEVVLHELAERIRIGHTALSDLAGDVAQIVTDHAPAVIGSEPCLLLGHRVVQQVPRHGLDRERRPAGDLREADHRSAATACATAAGRASTRVESGQLRLRRVVGGDQRAYQLGQVV